MIDEPREFERRRNLPHVEVTRMLAGRTWTVVLTIRGQEIGSKTEITKRGKAVTTDYFLPPLREQQP